DFSGMIMAITVVLNVVLLYSLTMDTAGRLTAEKESDSWLTLLSTPVDPFEILIGKGLASLWGWRIPLGFQFVCWSAGLLTNAIHPLSFAVAIIVCLVQMSFAIATGLYFGSRCKSFQAVAFRAVMLWLSLQLIVPIMLSALARDEGFLGIMPAFVSVGSLNIEELFKTNNNRGDSLAAMFLLGLIQIMIMAFTSAGLFLQCLNSFDRWNNRTLLAPDETLHKAVVWE
ncbi:MAG: hypothetical protein ACKO85_08280, partial [Isosphaeraceae bacterium]